MSAVPATITNDNLPASFARAYDELGDGLARLADSLLRGDLRDLLPTRQALGAPPEWLAPAVHLPAPGEPAPFLSEHRLASMLLELTKTAAVVLVLYQGALTFLPAPERPHFVTAPIGASPVTEPTLPSVTPAASIAADGRHTEVEVDGDVSSESTAVP